MPLAISSGRFTNTSLRSLPRSEGQKGGEFFTPRSVVRLMVEMIEPHGGKVFDPACGSGGMFVQSAQFIDEHRKELSRDATSGVYVYGQEKTLETVNLAKMNLAVNGLRGEIKKANTYYDDAFGSFGAFDYVLANPPFNVARSSLDEARKDYIKHLTRRGLRHWQEGEAIFTEARNLRPKTVEEAAAWINRPGAAQPVEERAANLGAILVAQAHWLTERLL